MQKSNLGIFTMENIFSDFSFRGNFWFILILATSFGYLIFYFNMPKPILVVPLFIFFLYVLLSRRKITFKPFYSGDDKHNYFKISTDFSWENSTEQISEALKRYESTWEHISTNFTLLSFPEDSHKKEENLDKYQDEYQKFIEINFPQIRKYTTILKTEKLEEIRKENIKNSMMRIGFKLEELEAFNERSIFKLFSEKSLFWKKNFLTGEFHYAIIKLDTIKDGIPFQNSEILRRASGDVLFVTDISAPDENGIQVVRRKASAILARARIREKDQKLKPEDSGKIQSSLRLKEAPDSKILNLKMFAIIRSHSPIELAEDVYRIMDLGNHFGAKFSIIWKPDQLRKLLTLNFSGFNYPILSEHISSMLPFLGTESSNEGIIIGKNASTGMPSHIDIFSGDSFNMLILGETGSGKTYFARITLWRMILSGKINRVLIVDPQREFQFFRSLNSLTMKNHCNLEIIDNMPDGIPDICQEFMSKFPDEKKVIIIDEAHLFIRNKEDRDKMSLIFRVSRHYNTSIFLITQDVEDFRNPPLNSIINNSSNVAIFRNKMWDSLDDFGISPGKHGYRNPESLKGGKSSSESEMFLYTHGRMKKVKIMASEWEKRVF